MEHQSNTISGSGTHPNLLQILNPADQTQVSTVLSQLLITEDRPLTLKNQLQHCGIIEEGKMALELPEVRKQPPNTKAQSTKHDSLLETARTNDLQKKFMASSAQSPHGMLLQSSQTSTALISPNNNNQGSSNNLKTNNAFSGKQINSQRVVAKLRQPQQIVHMQSITVGKLQGQHFRAKQSTTDSTMRKNTNSPPPMTIQTGGKVPVSKKDATVIQNEVAIKQSKTRNNLQTHVASSNLEKPKQVIVGQPYVSFKNQLQMGQLTTKTFRGKLESIERQERQNQAYLKQQQVAKSRYHQAKTSSKLSMAGNGKPIDLQKASSIDSDLLNGKFQSQMQHSLRNHQKSSFSQWSTGQFENLAENNALKYPKINAQRQQMLGGHQHSGREIEQPGSNFTNHVVNVGFPAAKQNHTKEFQRKHQKSQWALGLNSDVGVHQPTQTLRNKQSVNDYEDFPIAISDQEQRGDHNIKMPSIASASSKERVPKNMKTDPQFDSQIPTSKRLTVKVSPVRIAQNQATPLIQRQIGLLGDLSRMQDPVLRTLTQEKYIEAATPLVYQTVENDDNSSILQIELADDEALTVQAYPATRMSPAPVSTNNDRSVVSFKEQIYPMNEKNGGHTHGEMLNLSSYQSHAFASRQKGVGAIKKKQQSLKSSAAHATFIIEKIVSEEVVADGQQTFYNHNHARTSKRVGALYGKSSLSFRGTNQLNPPSQLGTGTQVPQQDRLYMLNSQLANQKPAGQQSQQLKKFAIKEAVKLEPILNNRYQNQEKTQKTPNGGQDGSNSARRNISQMSQNTNQIIQVDTANSVYLQPKPHQKRKTTFLGGEKNISKSGLKLHDMTNASFQHIRSGGEYHASQTATNQHKFIPTESAEYNQRTHIMEDELMLIQKENTDTCQISIMKPYTGINNTTSDGDGSNLEREEGIVEVYDFTSQDPIENGSTFNNSVVTSQTKERENRKPLNRHQESLMKKKNQEKGRKLKSLAAYEQLPYLKQPKLPKNLQPIDRKKLNNNASASLSPSPGLQSQATMKQSPAQKIYSKEIEGMRANGPQGRTSKGSHMKRKSINSSQESTEKGFSPKFRTTIDRSNNRLRESLPGKFGTNDYRNQAINAMDISMGLSSSLASLPRILNEEKNAYSLSNTRRLGNHRPSHNVVHSKQGFQSNNSPQLTQIPQLTQYPLNPKQQTVLTSKDTELPSSNNVKVSNRSLKNSTKSFSIFRRKGAPESKDSSFQSPKMKKQVSIREENLRTNPDEVRRKDKIKSHDNEDEATKKSTKGMIHQHNKSNSLAHPLPNNIGILSIKEVQNERDSRSLNTSIRQSNQSMRNHNNPCNITSTSGAQDSEHQIRIEISKTEVLDSMKKEQIKDLSLLYYDFNNSKARLMSKMKKMSDFVIEEEGEADGDAPQPPESNEFISPQTKRPIAVTRNDDYSFERNVKVIESDSPLTLRKPINKKNQPSTGIYEASAALKQLDLPANVRTSGVQSSHELISNQSKTQMEMINKKIDKAKQSISQMQTDGGVNIALQSPARLANSRNSSSKTLTQYAAQMGSYNQDEYQISNPSSAKKLNTKVFLFNQQPKGVNENISPNQRKQSPCFGSFKGSNSQEEVQGFNIGGSGSQSMKSLGQGVPTSHMQPMSGRSNQESVTDQNLANGCTGATQLEANFGTMATNLVVKNGMGTGFETSTTNQQIGGRFSKNKNKSNIHFLSGSPIPIASQSRRSLLAQESDLALQSSQNGSFGEEDLVGETAQTAEAWNVMSVVQFVKENKKIWE